MGIQPNSRRADDPGIDPIDRAVARFEGLAKQWAELDGEARRLEKMEKVVFSEVVNQLEGSIALREHAARANPQYRDIMDRMIKARTAANIAKAEVDAAEMRFEAWRTAQATKRAEMSLR